MNNFTWGKLDERFAVASTSKGAVFTVSDKPAPVAVKGKKLTKKQKAKLAKEGKLDSGLGGDGSGATGAKPELGSGDNFGVLPVIMSQDITGRVWTRVADVGSKVGEDIIVRGRVHTSRGKGRLAFLTVRQGVSTVQGVLFAGGEVSKPMVKFAAAISRESIVDVHATVVKAEKPVASCSVSDYELQVKQLWVVSLAESVLPFQVEDAGRPQSFFDALEAKREKGELTKEEAQVVEVSQDTRLNHRWIDLRTPANNAIVRISSTVCTLFREFLLSRDFVEIQSPKLLGGASEGGSAVFNLKYFEQDACLAQSPQLYKQMTAACSDLERVFEIGPVFRAEKSNTHRHLCEFHGLDMEMAIGEHYYEVLDVFSDLFIYIFDELNKRCKPELEAVRAQYPFEDLKFTRPSLRITYAEGIKLLQDAGVGIESGDDFTTEQERTLGRLVREKFGTDFFMMDRYPMSIRPFYTMPCPDDPTLSNSYDLFIRGEEIVSGAQRIHDVDMLISRAKACGIPVHTIQGYIDSFRHGALPHGGGGIGLERVVMLFLGLDNIRKAALFPRDPRRLSP